jgi:hypothetical protein
MGPGAAFTALQGAGALSVDVHYGRHRALTLPTTLSCTESQPLNVVSDFDEFDKVQRE